MTDNRMALLEMAEKAGSTDFLRDRVREVVHDLMEAEVASQCGAARHERNEARTDQRNGYRTRRWETRLGSMERQIPRLRHASALPSLLEPRRATEQALTAVVQEAYIQGVSTRSVDELAQAAGMTGISSSQVSRLCASIDERVSAFLERPIEGHWPYSWLDATYVKARETGRIVTKACVLAVGVNTEGRREVAALPRALDARRARVGGGKTVTARTGQARPVLGGHWVAGKQARWCSAGAVTPGLAARAS